MDISIIICSYNNYSQLCETLAAIENCDIPHEVSTEVILVNNASYDDTHRLKFHSSRKFTFRYNEEPKRGKSNALNTGIELSNGKLVIFTDDDVRPNREWITSYWKAYKMHGEKYIFGGNVVSIYEDDSFNKCILKYAPHSVSGLDNGDSEKILDENEYFIGANYAIPNSALKFSTGFKTNIGLNPQRLIPSVGEETEMQMSLLSKGYKRLHVPGAEIRHFVPSSKTKIRHTLKRRLAYGIYKSKIENNAEKNIAANETLSLIKHLLKTISWLIKNMHMKDIRIQKAHEIAFIFGKIIGNIQKRSRH